MNEFIKKNRKFWSKFKIKDNGRKILIEEPGRVMIIHLNAIFAMIINQAKGYVPVWLCKEHCQERQLLQSYFPNLEIISPQKKSFSRKLRKLKAIFIALIKFPRIYFTKDILGFYYDKVKYGDILYDSYLHENRVATIRKIDSNLLKLSAVCIFRHLTIKNILKSSDYAGVLVSHLIGIHGGIMLRTALRYGYRAYLRTGHHGSRLQCLKGLKEAYNYPTKAFPSDIKKIITQLGPNLEKIFLKTLEREISGKGNPNSQNAFSKDNRYYTNRASFNRDYKFDPGKKNVFIMLHVFNDHPHSHFRWMLFKDYYDWFIQTLNFAKKNNKVNWIFKQHPSAKYYIAKDVSFNKLFSKSPDNIIYIDENSQIDTRSLIYCADLVITCLGSVGFELPAMGAIPAVTASDNFYTKLGFTLEPKTKEEYFEILNKTDKTEKLSLQAQKRAQAAFIYIYRISNVNISACPILSESEERDDNISQKYWNRVLNQYSTKKNIILKELDKYIKAVAKPEFKRLISKP